MGFLADMRKSYERGGLDEAHAGNDPLALFRTWFGTRPTWRRMRLRIPTGTPSVEGGGWTESIGG